MVPVFTGTVTSTAISIDQPLEFRAYCRGLEGQRIELTVRKRRTKRSDQANRYYWGVVVAIIADHLGYEPEECHEALAWHFLAVKDDNKLPRRASTAKLDTAAFAAYVEQVKRWAATEFGLYIPEAGEVAA